MFVEVGNKILLEDLLLGVIIQSGNDASVALIFSLTLSPTIGFVCS